MHFTIKFLAFVYYDARLIKHKKPIIGNLQLKIDSATYAQRWGGEYKV
jgi:hypothetical protein